MAEKGEARPGRLSDGSLPAGPHQGTGHHTGSSWHRSDLENLVLEEWFCTFASEKCVSIFEPVSSICVGKTYVGLKIAQALLNNQDLWKEDNTPMLVVCYTNHALDQFLEGKQDELPSTIRARARYTHHLKSIMFKTQIPIPAFRMGGDMNFTYLCIEGIHRFLRRDIVRVGGRSNSEILKQFNLRQLSSSFAFKRFLPNHLHNAHKDVSYALNNTDVLVY